MSKSHYLGDGRVGEGIHIARGAVSQTSHVNKFGYNTAVGGSFEIVSDLGTNYLPTSAGVVSVVSSDANDDDGDTGARTLEIEGLDANYDEIKETITLNGTGAVTTTASFYRVFRMRVLTAGSSETNEGNITASIGGNNVAQVHSNNGGQSLMAVYTIPAGHKGYLIKFQGSISKNQEATYQLRVKNGTANAAWQMKGQWGTFAQPVTFDYIVPLEIPEKTDIQIQAKAGATSEVGAIFDLILVKDI
jgi:hypothetical protein